VGGATAITAYRREGDILVFTHTEVPEEMEGKGVGGKLLAGALADVREQGLTIKPLCSFVRHYVETHPETHDLLA
jgi:predicted GNAT family acetyltransferase